MFNFLKKKEKDSFRNWMERINNGNKPNSEINSFHFGIVETLENGYELYLVGSSMYGVDEEWDCYADFTPAEKYFSLKNEFGRTFSDKEWEELLENVVNLLKQFVASSEYEKHFISKSQAINAGFDGGDSMEIV